MSTGVRVPLAEAREVAVELTQLLRLSCHRIEIAGSVRRGKPDVGDIELVAVPIVEDEPDGMFDVRHVNRLTERVNDLIVTGPLDSHPTDPKRGERYSKIVHSPSGLQVDLFSTSRESFGIIFLIRTGPADYSHRFVTDMRRRGFHVGGGQLHRGGLGCGTYACEVVPTYHETDVFAALDMTPVPAELRA